MEGRKVMTLFETGEYITRIEGEGDVVSLLLYFVVVYSTFRVQMAKQFFAHILQRRICLNPSQGSADG